MNHHVFVVLSLICRVTFQDKKKKNEVQDQDKLYIQGLNILCGVLLFVMPSEVYVFPTTQFCATEAT